MARIIYAEDDEMMRELVQVALMDAGHAVGVVPDGKLALDVVRRRPPDLLILDMTMPEMSGSQVLEAIRRDPDIYALPVLILTGRQGRTDEAIAFSAGATEYLRKPFDPDALVVLVESLLRQRPAAASDPSVKGLRKI